MSYWDVTSTFIALCNDIWSVVLKSHEGREFCVLFIARYPIVMRNIQNKVDVHYIFTE
jgi:hypothetical protein